MQYASFLAAVLQGAYALFAAQQSGVQVKEIYRDSTRVVYECRQDTKLAKAFGLSGWTHSQTCYVNDFSMQVTDEIWWFNKTCTAERVYTVSADEETQGLYRLVNLPWTVKYRAGRGLTNKIISKAVKGQLEAADDAIFSAFTK